jgi:tRNA(adenine34) deaminase
MVAIANLSSLLGPTSVYSYAPHCALITSAEPCPMCMAAIEWSGFAAMYFGTSIDYISEHGGEQIMIYSREVADKTPPKLARTTIVGGVLRNETDPLYS